MAAKKKKKTRQTKKVRKAAGTALARNQQVRQIKEAEKIAARCGRGAYGRHAYLALRPLELIACATGIL